MNITHHIFLIFTKKHGITLSPEAVAFFQALFEDSLQLDLASIKETLDYVAAQYIDQNGKGLHPVQKHELENFMAQLFEKRAIHNTINLINEDESEIHDLDNQDISCYLKVVNTFDIPLYHYKVAENAFFVENKPLSFMANAEFKASAFRDRFNIIKQRVLRHHSFRPPSLSASELSYLKITPISNLKGKKAGEYLLFGMLTMFTEGKCHLEDLDATIELVIDDEKIEKGSGIFTLNCFVLVQGRYTEDATFIVKTLAMPLPESRQNSVKALNAGVDFFGGPQFKDDPILIQKIEKSVVDVQFLIISDVWLDQPIVFEKLRMMFDTLSQNVIPLAFILIGNFKSVPYVYNSENVRAYKETFDQFANLVAEYPEIAQKSHFIFVPGPMDPSVNSVLPRPPIPKIYTSRIQQKIKNVHFAGNPCRIKYCSQEIIIFREDLMNIMRRNALCPIVDSNEITLIESHLVSTIIDQAYLIPLPLNVKPVLWAHSHALSLYPVPNLLILADRYEPYETSYEGCVTVNPGSFPNTEFQFTVYYPASLKCESSQI